MIIHIHFLFICVGISKQFVFNFNSDSHTRYDNRIRNKGKTMIFPKIFLD